MRARLVVAAALALTGCVDTSEVRQLGKNIYAVDTTSQGAFGVSPGGELTEAAKAASSYCAGMGKHMIPLGADRHGIEQEEGLRLETTATYKFRCAARTTSS
jgi:hypothetical protein